MRPAPAGISLPMMTFSFRPTRWSTLPLMAASVRTLVVSWKENVIIGKLIPAGTGLNAYRHFAEELVPVTEEELQEEQSEEQATGVEALQEDSAQVLEETPAPAMTERTL